MSWSAVVLLDPHRGQTHSGCQVLGWLECGRPIHVAVWQFSPRSILLRVAGATRRTRLQQKGKMCAGAGGGWGPRGLHGWVATGVGITMAW